MKDSDHSLKIEKEEKKRAMKALERERHVPYSTHKKVVAIPLELKPSNRPVGPILNTELIIDVIKDIGSLFVQLSSHLFLV